VTAPRLLIVLASFALAAAACTSGETAPTTLVSTTPGPTTTTTAPPPTTTSTTTTTSPQPTTTTAPPPTTTTTTVAPLASLVIEGDLPDGLAEIVEDLYLWIADDRRPMPAIPPAMRGRLYGMPPPTDPWRTVSASTAELPTGERVAVIHVDRDLLFAADEGDGWEIVGASMEGVPLWLGGEPKFLLVLGSDARPGQVQERHRADSIHILALAPGGGGGTIIGFPRDTYVPGDIIDAANERVGLSFVPGSIKWTNLMASRGPEIMLETAKEMTGLPISGYVVTGFKGFDALIRAIGGIVIDVPRNVPSGRSDTPGISAGEQELNAARTLLLARVRKTIPGGDFTRSLHQGLIILAAMAMVQNRGVDAVPDLLRILHEEAWTDLPAGDLLQLAATGLLMDPADLDNLVLSGRVRNISGASVVLLDEDEFEQVIADVADDAMLEPPPEDG
jgi:LCP family protein required for cell wall assembly